MKRQMWLAVVCWMLSGLCGTLRAETGYKLWLCYRPTTDATRLAEYKNALQSVSLPSTPFDEAIKGELLLASREMLSQEPTYVDQTATLRFVLEAEQPEEGYTIREQDGHLTIAAREPIHLLYGTYHLLRLMLCNEPLAGVDLHEKPAYQLRVINHWDDLDGSIERGYAGKSIWKWDELPATLSPRYTDYARALASVGINALVLNNVNADSRILRTDYLEKVAALAGVFRGYGIRVYLSANFGACLKPASDIRKGGIGDLTTANPKDATVIAWWREKINEIYTLIPDFGGFLVKANSEGMPGPQTYGCTHADGANLFARLLKPHGGIVMWRTFVYSDKVDADRVKRSYKEFEPLDGDFDDNVVLQTKNGPLDFQPLEPPHPLFGALKRTAIMPELQITQEYTGQSTYLVYLMPLWKDFLTFDTHHGTAPSDIAALTTDAARNNGFSAIAGVANIGEDTNWTRHHFAQANWYAFARLAWNPWEDADRITRDWIRCTWGTDETVVETILDMMNPTWMAYSRAHTPYAMGMTCAASDHFKADFSARANKYWNVGAEGLGTNRSTRGTDYASQYAPVNRDLFDNISTCPEHYLLCFHQVPWTYIMPSGLTFYEELRQGLMANVNQVRTNTSKWKTIRARLKDTARYNDVLNSLSNELSAAQAYYTAANSFFKAYKPDESSIDDAPDASSATARTVCYDLSGRTATPHSRGVLIEQTSTTTRKTLR